MWSNKRITVKIIELTGKEGNKYEEEKEKKLRKDFDKIKTKQESELNAFLAKKNSIIDNERKNRALQFDTLLQKYKNRRKELENIQNFEVKNYSKIAKGISSTFEKLNRTSRKKINHPIKE
jgi:hypothetical protein